VAKVVGLYSSRLTRPEPSAMRLRPVIVSRLAGG